MCCSGRCKFLWPGITKHYNHVIVSFSDRIFNYAHLRLPFLAEATDTHISYTSQPGIRQTVANDMPAIYIGAYVCSGSYEFNLPPSDPADHW